MKHLSRMWRIHIRYTGVSLIYRAILLDNSESNILLNRVTEKAVKQAFKAFKDFFFKGNGLLASIGIQVHLIQFCSLIPWVDLLTCVYLDIAN